MDRVSDPSAHKQSLVGRGDERRVQRSDHYQLVVGQRNDVQAIARQRVEIITIQGEILHRVGQVDLRNDQPVREVHRHDSPRAEANVSHTRTSRHGLRPRQIDLLHDARLRRSGNVDHHQATVTIRTRDEVPGEGNPLRAAGRRHLRQDRGSLPL